MKLRQITYLLAVVEEGSFTRAAERLSVAQPSLSQQVRALERELGGPLLERMPNGVQLTAAGRAFLPEALARWHRLHADTAVYLHEFQHRRGSKYGVDDWVETRYLSLGGIA